MKQNFSVLALSLRLKMKWVLITMAVMPLITLSVYLLGLGERTPAFSSGYDYILSLVVFAGGSLMTALQCSGILSGKNRKSNILARLQISEQRVLVWEIVACVLFFLILWQVEIITIGVAGLIHNSSKWNVTGPQGIVVAIYCTPFYRNVVPAFDVLNLLRGICCVLCSGIICGCISMDGGKSAARGVGIVVLILLSLLFMFGWRVEFVFFIVLGTLLTVVLTVRHLNGGKEDSENEE